MMTDNQICQRRLLILYKVTDTNSSIFFLTIVSFSIYSSFAILKNYKQKRVNIRERNSLCSFIKVVAEVIV